MTPAGARRSLLTGRVAESPAVGLRFELDAHAADLDHAAAAAERALIEATAQRSNLMRQLRRNEEARRAALASIRTIAPHTLVRTLHDGVTLADDLTRQEARVAALKERVDRLTRGRDVLREVSAGIRDAVPVTAAFDERAGLLNQASRSLFQLVDAEHEALAHSVLDGAMQHLTDAVFEAEVAERSLPGDVAGAGDRLARCRRETLAAAGALERAVQRLNPLAAGGSLAAALRQRFDGVPARLQVVGAARRLPPLVELAIYRIAEEAVENATRHGRPTSIEVVLSYHPGRVGLIVRDDGEGFDVVATEARLGRTRGLGMIRMQGQAALLGSRLEIRSMLGAGTEVRATLPQSV